MQPADHLEARLAAVEPGQECDAALIVERWCCEDVAAECFCRIQNRSSFCCVSSIIGLHRSGGGRINCSENTQQCVRVMTAVAVDELGIVEIVASVESHT